MTPNDDGKDNPLRNFLRGIWSTIDVFPQTDWLEFRGAREWQPIVTVVAQPSIDELRLELQQLRDDYDARGMALARLETEKELLERFTEELLKTIKEIGMRK